MLTTTELKTTVALTVNITLSADEQWTLLAGSTRIVATTVHATASHAVGVPVWALTVIVYGRGPRNQRIDSVAKLANLPKPVRVHLAKTLWDAGVEEWTEGKC